MKRKGKSLLLLLTTIGISFSMPAVEAGAAVTTSVAGQVAAATTVTVPTPKLSSAVNTTSGVKVTWGKVTGATGYRVYRKTAGGSWSKIADVSSGSTVTYTDTKAASGTTYFYTVRALKGTAISSYDKTGVSVLYLASPKLSSAANVTKGVKVTWNKVSGASGYRIYRKVSGGSWSKIADVSGVSTLNYTDTTPASGTTYIYTVRAKKGNTLSSYYGTGVSTLYLSVPSLTSIANVNKNYNAGVTVKWGKVTGATGYNVYRKVSGGSWSKIGTVNSGSTVSYKDTTTADNTTYVYTVRATKGSTLSYYNTTGLQIKTLGKDISTIKASLKLTVAGKTYYLGQAATELGTPKEKLTSSYGFTWYVYGTGTYKDFFAAGVANGKVVVLASAGPGFTYQGMKSGSKVGSYSQDGCLVTIATDKNDKNIVHGVFIRDTKYTDSSLYGKSYTSAMLSGESKMNFYFTNAFRVYHGLSALTWCDKAAKASRLHSQDMADQNYFAHNSLDGRTPWDRMKTQGISYSTAAENICAGNYTGFAAYNSWVNSSGHRTNMLNKNLQYLGVGGGYNAKSTYKIYFTQDFYKK